MVTLRSSVLVLLAACGSTTPAPVVGGTSDPIAKPGVPASPGKGTTGVGTLDWGASQAAVKAVFPQAEVTIEGGLYELGNFEGMPARVSFRFDAKGLAKIDVEWTARYADMGACMRSTWTELRGKYDAKFGESQSDNGAAYWKTSTVAIEVACNPNDAATAMVGTFQPLIDS